MFINEQAGVIWQMDGDVWDELSWMATSFICNHTATAMTQAAFRDAIKMMVGV